LQSGQECLTYVIQKGVEQVAEWYVFHSSCCTRFISVFQCLNCWRLL
jgi:hypothetical protein